MRQIFTKTQKMRIFAVKVIYCNSCVTRTLKCNACSRHEVTFAQNTKTHYVPYITKPPIARKRAWLSRTFFFQATCSKLIHADNISFFFKNSSWNLGEKYVYVRNPTSISHFPIEFNGKNGVFRLSIAQKLFR